MDDLRYLLKCGSKLSHNHSSPKDPADRLNIAMPINNKKYSLLLKLSHHIQCSLHLVFDKAVHKVQPSEGPFLVLNPYGCYGINTRQVTRIQKLQEYNNTDNLYRCTMHSVI